MNLYTAQAITLHLMLASRLTSCSLSTSVVTIGFNGTHSVHEDARVISIVVLVLMNSLARDVVVTLSTVDDTASGRFAGFAIYVDHY